VNSQVTVALITAAASIIVALVGFIKFPDSNISALESSFQYQVRVQDRKTNEYLSSARVTIEMADVAPLDTYTDNNGYTQMVIDTNRAGKPARIIVEAEGYQRYEQSINLTRDSLPDVIKLETTS
jgi:hypothetical protein